MISLKVVRNGVRTASRRRYTTVEKLRQSSSNRTDVKLHGWVQRSQKSGKFSFLHVNDGLSTDTVQVVVPRTICESAPVGSAVAIVGSWEESSGSQQSRELCATECKVLATDTNPRYSSLSADNLRKSVHLRSRAPSFAALLRMRSRLLRQTHEFFMSRDYVHIDTPILTANDCEGAGETFSVVAGNNKDGAEFFSNDGVFLTVSGQLHLEAMTSGIARVYTLNGGFRAEKQQSSSHLTEFRMLEAELAFCQSLDEICQVSEDYVRSMADYVLSDSAAQTDMTGLGVYTEEGHGSNVLAQLASQSDSSSRFPRMTFDEAVRILADKKQKRTENGLNKQNEAFLVKYCQSPVFITHFPSNQKPFYMSRSADGTVTDSFDLLCPIVGELAGGSVRESSTEALKERGANVDWYLDLRSRGKPVSAGFGLGFERLIQVLLGVRNIKDTIPFPRWFKHCQC